MLRIIMLSLLLAGCGQSPGPQAINNSPVHNYAVFMEGEYGYEKQLTQKEKEDGKVTSALLMFKYLGEQKGVHQAVHTDSNGVDVVIECESPCKFLRTYVLSGNTLHNKEVMKADPNSIGGLVMDDAVNGRLEQIVYGEGKNRWREWYSNSKIRKLPMNVSATSPGEHYVSESGIEYTIPTTEEVASN